MSEQINQNFNAASNHETHQQSREMLAILDNEAKQAKNEHHKTIETLRANIEHHAIYKEDTEVGEQGSEQRSQSHHYLTEKIKAQQYKKTLQSTRQSLRPTDAIISRFIHNPTVETISGVGSKTVARPTAILSGALVSAIGGILIIWVAKKVGFELPFSLIIVLYVAGYFIGLFLEILLGLIDKNKHQKI